MTTARALIASAVLIALVLAGAAWWFVRGIPADRYQLVNVGKGETQRLDRETGTIMRCANGQCEALTDGAKAIDKPDEWAGFKSAPDKADPWPGTEVPPPPVGRTVTE